MKKNKELTRIVEGAVKKTLNGQIAALDVKLTARLDAQDLAIKPMLEAFTQAKGAITLLKVIVSLISIVGAVIGFYKFKDSLK